MVTKALTRPRRDNPESLKTMAKIYDLAPMSVALSMFTTPSLTNSSMSIQRHRRANVNRYTRFWKSFILQRGTTGSTR